MKAIFFDKTGTITVNEVKLDSVIISQTQSNKPVLCPVTQDDYLAPVDDESHHKRLLLIHLSTNHSLAFLDNAIQGDSLEAELFKFTGSEFPKQVEDMFRSVATFITKNIQMEKYMAYSGGLQVLHSFEYKPELQRMSVIVCDTKTGKNYVFTKGAPEKITKLCTEASKPLELHDQLRRCTEKGYRVIVLAYRQLPADFKQVDYSKTDSPRRLRERSVVPRYSNIQE